METPFIEFKDVTKRFNGTTVLDRANLTIHENQITTIIGKSGGTYDELTRLRHPMIDEFLKSIEGLQGELTGLLSKKMFRSRDALTLGRGRVDTTITAVLLSVHFDFLTDMVGPQAATEVPRALGEYVNEYFDPLGGFSSRHRRGEILTILPHMGLEEAGQLVHDFSQGLQQKLFPISRHLPGSKQESRRASKYR